MTVAFSETLSQIIVEYLIPYLRVEIERARLESCQIQHSKACAG